MQKFLDFFTYKKKLKSNPKWCQLQLFFLVKPGKNYTQRYNCNQAVEGTEAWLLYKSK